MPELPEVEAARRQLAELACGQKVTSVWTSPDPVVFDKASPEEVAEALRGRKILQVRRYGKYFWCELDTRPWPVIHFGMTGSLEVLARSAPRPAYAKLDLIFSNGARIVIRDPRRFGRVRLAHDPRAEPPLSHLGYDPMLDLPTSRALTRSLHRRQRLMKAVLLDQRLFAGVGNWVADEVLYQSGIAPTRRSSSLSESEVKKLRQALKRVITVAVAARGNEIRFPKTWLFHHRWSAKSSRTSRGEVIVRETIAGRTTAWVPEIQS